MALGPMGGRLMHIAMVCTQPPGYGGAATSTYEAIKYLRLLGADVTGFFVDHCGGCEKGWKQPFDALSDWHDPEDIGGIVKVPRCKASKPDAFAGDFDVVVGKNYGAAMLLRGIDTPTAMITSGLSFLSRIRTPVTEIHLDVPETSEDVMAIESVDEVIVHSTLIQDYYLRHLPPRLLPQVVAPVIPTPDLAVPRELPDALPYLDRPFDVALLASSWSRPVKNRWLAKYVSLRVGAAGGRVVVVGDNWGSASSHEDSRGLVSHEEALVAVSQARVVVIPSLLDASPGVYTEAIALGCNVVVSPNVGNCWEHPAELMAADLDPGHFAEVVAHAVLQSRQLHYRTIDPMATARMLLDRLGQIARRG
jgi:hypothetical protein